MKKILNLELPLPEKYTEDDLGKEIKANLKFCQKVLGFSKENVELAVLMQLDFDTVLKFVETMQEIK
jgi:hypothetical protein